MKKYIAILLILSPLLFSYLPSSQFITLPTSALNSSLGESMGALYNVTSNQYNPSALKHKDIQLNFSYTRHFAKADLYNSLISKELGKYNLSLEAKTFIIPDIEKREIASDDPLMTFSSNHFQLKTTVANHPLKWLSVGGDISYIYEDIDYYSSQGYTFGFGFLISQSSYSIGASAINIGNITQDKLKYKTPQTYNLMGSFEIPYKIKGNNPTLALAFSKPDYAEYNGKIGLIYEYRPVRFNVGYSHNTDSRDISFGLGILFDNFEVDYSTIPYRNSLGWNHTVSLQIQI